MPSQNTQEMGRWMTVEVQSTFGMSSVLECCSTCVYCRCPWEFLLYWYSSILYTMLYGNYSDSGHGSLWSISGIFLVVVLFMGHLCYRKLTFLRLATPEIWVVFLSNLWVPCGKYCALTEYRCTLRLPNLVQMLFESGNIVLAKQRLGHCKAGI